jgi:hypothetical protein
MAHTPETPEELVQLVCEQPELIPDVKKKLAARNMNLSKICSLLEDENVIKMMFMTPVLTDAIKKEGQCWAFTAQPTQIN